MAEFEKNVNTFLEFKLYKILNDDGHISHKLVIEKAHEEYEIFNKTHLTELLFDNEMKNIIDMCLKSKCPF